MSDNPVLTALKFAAEFKPSADRTKLLLQVSALKTLAAQALESLEEQPLNEQASAREDILLSICRVTHPAIFARGLHPLEKDGPATRQTIESTVANANKILDAVMPLIWERTPTKGFKP